MDQLREVSKEKHRIISRYFPPWATILGMHSNLVYVDCFAGSGKYGKNEPGSPLIILKEAKNLIQQNKVKKFILIFIEKNQEKAKLLESILDATPNSRYNIEYYVFPEDAENTTDEILEIIPSQWPSFFFIDPYWHPIPLPTIKKILSQPRREVLLNLMWYSINRDLNNPQSIESLNQMFGHHDWRNQTFMQLTGAEREEQFLNYIEKQIEAEYSFNFRIRFGPDERITSNRTKYYLMHFSNHYKAVLIMKEAMYPLGDYEGAFDYSATQEGSLFNIGPNLSELKEILLKKYSGNNTRISFEDILKETYKLHFIEKHYRQAIKDMDGTKLNIQRVESQRTGLKGKDIIIFN